MGLMGQILGMGGAARDIGAAVGGVAEVFVGNRAERDAASKTQQIAAREQFGTEFAAPAGSGFDGMVDGLNRLPRPMLALGTLGLFVYAMAEPAGFALRMEGLALVPEPLWWLLGAIVSFYFGARELHYQRVRTVIPRLGGASVPTPAAPPSLVPARLSAAASQPGDDPDFNAAVEEWRRLQS
jgi:hypothetical protein